MQEVGCKMIDVYKFNLDKILSPNKEVIHDQNKMIERLQEQLDIMTEQRNDIHIDKQVLQKQLNEANRIIKKLYKESGNPIGIDYLEKWGVK